MLSRLRKGDTVLHPGQVLNITQNYTDVYKQYIPNLGTMCQGKQASPEEQMLSASNTVQYIQVEREV